MKKKKGMEKMEMEEQREVKELLGEAFAKLSEAAAKEGAECT